MSMCECRGGLGGDGLATERWMGSRVCKVCKRIDQIRNAKQPLVKKNKTTRKTETMEKFVYHHGNKWVVKRKINKITKYLGSFETKKEAVEFRDKLITLLPKKK